MLVDTGADKTCISLAAAKKLGIRPTGLVSTFGAGGIHENEVYAARMELGVGDGSGAGVVVSFEQEVIAVPDLEKSFAGLGITVGGAPTEVVGLLGRDFLRNVTFVYDGPRSVVDYQLHLEGIPNGPRT